MLSGFTSTVTRSTGLSRSFSDTFAASPRISPPFGFTGTIRPLNPDASRLRNTAPPELVGRSPAPTTAMLVGFRKLLIASFVIQERSLATKVTEYAKRCEMPEQNCAQKLNHIIASAFRDIVSKSTPCRVLRGRNQF